MKKLVAVSPVGQEFFYNRATAHAVPVSSAKKICAALNAAGYKLKPGEVWTVHDCGAYEMEYTSACFQRFGIRQGRVYAARC